MKVYLYDKETNKYIGSREAILDVLETKKQGEDVYARPANSTFTQPPETKETEVAVYNKAKDSWTIQTSNVGKYVLNSKTGKISKITTEIPIRTYETVLTEEQVNDIKENPIKYEIIDGVLTDISKTQKYQNKYNIALYERKIIEEKAKYDTFLNTPVKYKGAEYLPRYLDDFYKLQARTFPMEIWDSDGTSSKVMTLSEFKGLVRFLEEKVSAAYKTKKENIKRYKLEIQKLG